MGETEPEATPTPAEAEAASAAVRPEALLRIGDALGRGDLYAAQVEIAQAGGVLVVEGWDDEDPPPGDGDPKRRRRKPAQVDPSGYPAIASLDARQVLALVRACWARCHGESIERTGRVAPLRALEKRGLVEQVPASISGRDGKGRERVLYAATALGALVTLKALLKGNARVVRASQALRG